MAVEGQISIDCHEKIELFGGNPGSSSPIC